MSFSPTESRRLSSLEASIDQVRIVLELGLILKNPLIMQGVSTRHDKQKGGEKEVMKSDRSKALIVMLSLVTVAAILGTVALTVSAADDGEESSNGFPQWIAGRCGWGRRGLRGWGRFGFVEVSEEFEENVLTIAKSDGDVLDLLDEGYSISGVRPMIKARVEANGDVVTKATSAVVMLEKDTTSIARVWVDVEEGKVTEIVILTRTVIEKP